MLVAAASSAYLALASGRQLHTLAVNCYLRIVFCNALGAIPFSLGDDLKSCLERESAVTHDNVARLFMVKRVVRITRMLRKKAA